jgi:hypothetical protein
MKQLMEEYFDIVMSCLAIAAFGLINLFLLAMIIGAVKFGVLGYH